ncbi:hypothetical protein GGI15_004343 [Coemansia interrupta]|uniref:Cyclin N-terminal domain-containing protein n=1 Tax=Coemansia interrupta TaxID=1126814 RepID=A0A9W8H6L7_9FUNG|nr:hypothetical protein GGI15_004343 [Coemansia interrupta]
MNPITLSNEHLAQVVTRSFAKLWMPRGSGQLHPFQKFCYDLLCATQIAAPIVMLALLYMNKFKQRFPGLHGGIGSEYRMFVVSLMLASKYLEDNTFTTQTWSEVSQLPAKELAIMQREFLVALDHSLHVPKTEFDAWLAQVQTIVLSGNQGYSGIALSSPPIVDMCSPVDYQVVPSPVATQFHEAPTLDMLPTPPSKRIRPSAIASTVTYPAYYATSNAPQTPTRARPVLEPISIPSQTLIMPPAQQYTPPLTSTGFAQGEFTFQVPAACSGTAMSLPAASCQQQNMVFAQQQSHQAIKAVYGASDIGYGVSSAGTVLPPAIPVQHFGAPVPVSAGVGTYSTANGFVGSFYDKVQSATVPSVPSNANAYMQQHLPSNYATVAAALVTQYPSLYYGTPGFFPGAASTFPIHSYGV